MAVGVSVAVGRWITVADIVWSAVGVTCRVSVG